jgi:predicted enzyme related to lactoylglutathione lyase
MTRNPVGWFEIYVQDVIRARKFYESVFQLKLERLSNTSVDIWAFPMDMAVPGAAGALVKMDGFSSGGNSTLIYFSCEDCAIEERRATQFGGRIQRNKMSIGEYGFISLVFDTEENMIGLHSLK